MKGILLVDKEKGPTSHDVVDEIREVLEMKRVGHAGTLDPDATGLLVVLIGEATKLSQFISADNKSYHGSMVLGIRKDTLDKSGLTISKEPVEKVEKRDIEKVFSSFVGRIKQTTPKVSAVKVNGKALYVYARNKQDVDQPIRDVEIYDLSISKIRFGEFPMIDFSVECSKGTYIRALAAEIGEKLGYGAYLHSLRRLRSGAFSLREAITISDIRRYKERGGLDDVLITLERAVEKYPAVKIKPSYSKAVRNGSSVKRDMYDTSDNIKTANTLIRVIDQNYRLIAVHKFKSISQPTEVVRVFNS